VSTPSDVIDSPPRRFWLAGNVGLAQICDLAHGHLANVGGKPRLIELKQGLSPGPLGLTDYLDRLEEAAPQSQLSARPPTGE
jgi:hypothetical protein